MYRHTIKRKVNLRKLAYTGVNYYKKISEIIDELLKYEENEIDFIIDEKINDYEIDNFEKRYLIKLLESIKTSPVKYKKQLLKLMRRNYTTIPVIINENEIEEYERFIKINLENIYENLVMEITKPYFISKIKKIFVYFVEDYKSNCLRIELTFIYNTKYKELKYTASIDPGYKNIISIYTYKGNGYILDVKFKDLEIENNKLKIINKVIKKFKDEDVRYLFIGDKSLRFGTFLCGKYLLWSEWEKKYYHNFINDLIAKCSENSIYVMYLDESYSSTIKKPVNVLEIDKNNVYNFFSSVIKKERIVEVEFNKRKKKIPRDLYSCVFMLNQAGGINLDLVENLKTEFIKI